MRTIPLTKGYEAIVDDEDYEWLSQWKWYVSNGNTVYARRSCDSQMMHRLILGIRHPMICDHKNRNGLDNRRCNLRKCSRNQNMWNRTTGTRHPKGCYWNLRLKKWQVYIKYNNQDHYLGSHKTQKDAADAYNVAAQKYFGEFACLTTPQKP